MTLKFTSRLKKIINSKLLVITLGCLLFNARTLFAQNLGGISNTLNLWLKADSSFSFSSGVKQWKYIELAQSHVAQTCKDATPHMPVCYYRIKGISNSGAESYSEVRVVYFGNAIPTLIKVQPIPSNDYVVLGCNWEGTTQIEITNAQGALVLRSSVQENVDKNIDVLTWSEGVYFVQFSNNGLREVRKIIVQR